MKYLFTIINLVMVAAMAYFCVDIMYKIITPDPFEQSDNHVPGALSGKINPLRVNHPHEERQNNVIVKRNFFNVEVEKPKPLNNKHTNNIGSENLEETSLKLVLWGTVTGGDNVFAVIEDRKTKKQSLYAAGDLIQGARIKKILRHEVILTWQGKDEVLKMDNDQKNAAPKLKMAGKIIKSLKNTDIIGLSEKLQEDAGLLEKQIKLRSYFFGGEPDGLMAYGIRPGSVFKQMGLRNGDIIKEINGTSIVSEDDASTLYSEIKETENINITILRRGKEKQLVFQIKGDEK